MIGCDHVNWAARDPLDFACAREENEYAFRPPSAKEDQDAISAIIREARRRLSDRTRSRDAHDAKPTRANRGAQVRANESDLRAATSNSASA
jgi:hypothetical protein